MDTFSSFTCWMVAISQEELEHREKVQVQYNFDNFSGCPSVIKWVGIFHAPADG